MSGSPSICETQARIIDHDRGAPAGRHSAAIRDRLIVCIASRWDIDPTSKHQVMTILSRTNDVLWVNYHGSRRPKINRKDASWAMQALRRVAAGPRRINDRMVQYTPFVIPGASSGVCGMMNRLLVTSQVRRIANRVRRRADQPVQLWSFAPDVGFLAGALREECLVYYCVDDFSRFDGYDAAAVTSAEQELIRAADVVITTSAALQADKSRLHSNVQLVRHGVDYAHFRTALDAAFPAPAVLAGISRPIAGFVGLVQSWVDLELLCEVAALMPDVSFVIVGDTCVDVSQLAALGNVHLLGRRPYAELPALLAQFDVGLIPFIRNKLTERVNPIKLREYLAAGLPVVSTDLPEVRAYAPCVQTAGNAAEFAQAIRASIDAAETGPATRRARRLACSTAVANEDWAVVVKRLSQIVAQAASARRWGDAAAAH